MGKSTLKAMMMEENPNAAAFDGMGSLMMGKGHDDFFIKGEPGVSPDDRQASGAGGGGNDNNSTFSGDTHQAGNVSAKNPTMAAAAAAAAAEFNGMGGMMPYYGMTAGGAPGTTAPGSGLNPMMMNGMAGMGGGTNNPEDMAAAMQSPDSYREWFKNVRNVFPPGMGAHLMPGMSQAAGNPAMYGATPEELQRMMLARAMGQGGGMPHNGKRRVKRWINNVAECHESDAILFFV